MQEAWPIDRKTLKITKCKFKRLLPPRCTDALCFLSANDLATSMNISPEGESGADDEAGESLSTHSELTE